MPYLRPLGTPPRMISIERYVFPWMEGYPVLLRTSGSSDRWMPLFSTAEKLRSALAQMHVAFDTIKQIDDQEEFLDSLSEIETLRIMIDPYVTETGRLRFIEASIRPKRVYDS